MSEDNATPTIDVNYMKSGLYREVSCDGALGGPTPANKFWIGFYTERLPIPRVVQHQLKDVGNDGYTIDPDAHPAPVEGRMGIVRNLEFGLYLTPETARQLHEWLGRELSSSVKEGGT